jgi:GTP-binding protein HflX
VPSVAIVGYTNAGKSSLLNALSGREAARAEDQLFATLDPTSRSVKLGDGQSVVLTDTVGFIHKLPHQLVDAFRATLEEVSRADLLLEVVDGSDKHAREHRDTVQAVLDELGAGKKPRVVALNKADLYDASHPDADVPAPMLGEVVPVSAVTGYGLDALRLNLSTAIARLWEHVDVTLPYAEGELLARVRERGTVEVDYRDTDVHITGRVVPSLAGELRAAADRWHGAAGVAP